MTVESTRNRSSILLPKNHDGHGTCSTDQGLSRSVFMSPDDTGGTTLVLRLTKKLAEEVDGISLVGYRVGDLLHLSRKDADVLLAEGWAEVVAEQMYIVGQGADRRAYR